MTDWGEDEMERVLRGLREVEGAPGMEARVLARLAAERTSALERVGRGWRGGWTASFRAWGVVAETVRRAAREGGAPGGVGWGGVLAVVVLVVVVGAWRGQGGHAGSAAPEGTGVRGLKGAGGTSVAGGDRVTVPPASVGHAKDRSVAFGKGHGRERRVAILAYGSVEEGRELSVVAAESFPAPPMPLTRQERLLLRMLRGGESAELVATLSPQAQAAMQRQEGMRRQEFFAPNRPEIEAEWRATGIKDAGTPVDGVGHVGPALRMSTEQANATGEVRKKE